MLEHVFQCTSCVYNGLKATPSAQTQLPEIGFHCTSCVYNGLKATPFAQTQLPEAVFQCTSCVYNGLQATPFAILFRYFSDYKSYHYGAERTPRLAVVVRGLNPATGCIAFARPLLVAVVAHGQSSGTAPTHARTRVHAGNNAA